ncbi:pancreatic lipase-related protein 2-like [Babylonia areolata]|uniref:pancreatic lipase-related protein 2-like n=1 Tax=Babylonia areolata TaxID=304850 RepID=UPI003FD306CC
MVEEESSQVELMTRAGESLREASAPKTLLTTKRKTRIGTWNIRTLYETGRTAQVSREMHRYNLKILGLLCLNVDRIAKAEGFFGPANTFPLFLITLIAASASASPSFSSSSLSLTEDQEDDDVAEKEPLERGQRTTPSPNSTVCYEAVGCFSNLAPFDNANNELPQPPDFVNTTFMLYTRRNAGEHDYEVLSYKNDTSLADSGFNSQLMTRVIVHGFSNSGFEKWVQKMKDAFLELEDSNVIVVHWQEGARMPMYPNAVANTRLVGRQLRLLLVKLVEEAGLQLDRTHLVGHSLGAHTSGYAGRDLEGQLYRITALDPAGPLFDKFSPTLDLDSTDARFVDVIHSNAKPLNSGGAGLYRQIGHIDFYINGGKTQPGCRDGLSAIFNMFSEGGIGEAVACSHGRSHEVFIESITSECPFTSYPCHSFDGFQRGECLDCGQTGCSELGLYADQHSARGTRYLKTRDDSPYCGFHYSVTIETAAGGRDSSGQLSVQLTGTWGSTAFLAVTEEKETLKTGTAYGGVVVASTEVGIIQTLSIRYNKASSWFSWFGGGGRDTFSVDRVHVVSGESGLTYTFCLPVKQLTDDHEVTLTVEGADAC